MAIIHNGSSTETGVIVLSFGGAARLCSNFPIVELTIGKGGHFA